MIFFIIISVFIVVVVDVVFAFNIYEIMYVCVLVHFLASSEEKRFKRKQRNTYDSIMHFSAEYFLSLFKSLFCKSRVAN